MPRRIFISYEGRDRDLAKGFHPLRWNTKRLGRQEIQWSQDEGNGILGIKLKGHAGAAVLQALTDCGAEIIDWDPDGFADAIERAARAAGRAAVLARSEVASGGARAR